MIFLNDYTDDVDYDDIRFHTNLAQCLVVESIYLWGKKIGTDPTKAIYSCDIFMKIKLSIIKKVSRK